MFVDLKMKCEDLRIWRFLGSLRKKIEDSCNP